MANTVTVAVCSGTVSTARVRNVTYLIRGNWTVRQLREQYYAFQSKFKSSLPFDRWLVEYGKVYTRVR